MTNQGAWTDARLRAAWASGDWSNIFREYRRASGVSQLALGSLVGMPQSHVSLIENGKRQVTSADVISRITEGLDVPNELRGLPGPPDPEGVEWGPNAELNERIARAHSRGRVDVRSADWIARVLAEHRRAEDMIGGKELWPVVRSQLDAVTRLLPLASGPVADKLLILAGEHAHWLSWVAAGEGRRGAAVAWLDLANGWALDAGSADLASWITRVRSYYTLNNGDPIRALRIAEAARRSSGDLSPAASSIALHATSLALAAVGDRDTARRLSQEAYTKALEAPDEGDRPGWLYWLDPVRAKLNLGEAAHAARDWSVAADAFREGLAGLDGYPRDQEFYAARLAEARQRS
ncbi:helix-turn-helix transcriptional regulator [Streptomyces sp. NPDC006798]|uniref:helix-turn-helix transcriptional regulator n=1 Tax=Streptomyces sp. NPDC006798 TaxID=3155462 RepID=UPI0033D3F176